MWEQYKKTFARTQAVIAVITFATYVYLGHDLRRSAAFLLMMELGAIAGAMWGVRLRRKVDRGTP